MGRKLTDEELKEFQEKRKDTAEKISHSFGITIEELEIMENEAREATYNDTAWEKELDARNKAKAGIK